MNRFVSNLILGFFVIILVVVYGVFKQPPTYSLQPLLDDGKTEQIIADIADINITLPNGATMNVIVVTSLADRQQGLAGITSLADGAGMLFVFPNIGQHGIWMRDMEFPLDIIWLDETGKVVYVVAEAPVLSDKSSELLVYQNKEPAKYVLEFAAGTAESAGIEVGDMIILS